MTDRGGDTNAFVVANHADPMPSGPPRKRRANPAPGASASAAISETSGAGLRPWTVDRNGPGMDAPKAYVAVRSLTAAPSCSIIVSSPSACFQYCSAMR
jgi:hypothetical protein